MLAALHRTLAKRYLTDKAEGPIDETFGPAVKSSTSNSINNMAGKAISSSQAVITKPPIPHAMESIANAIDVAAKYSYPPTWGVIKITNVSCISVF